MSHSPRRRTGARTRVGRKQPSLREHALYNSFYAKALSKANRRIYGLKKRIETMEDDRASILEELVIANQRVDALLLLGHQEETIKYELRQLRAQKQELELEIVKLKKVLHKLKINLREGFKRN